MPVKNCLISLLHTKTCVYEKCIKMDKVSSIRNKIILKSLKKNKRGHIIAQIKRLIGDNVFHNVVYRPVAKQ
jgi:hypothetical protein